MSQSWHLMLLWGVVVGVGTGSMALVFAATIANRWFVKRRGLVIGVLTAAGASGQLVFLPSLARLAQDPGWRLFINGFNRCFFNGSVDLFLFKRGSTKC